MRSVKPSASEIADALYQEKEQLMLGEDSGLALRLHTSFR
jgi:hypothetical protein